MELLLYNANILTWELLFFLFCIRAHFCVWGDVCELRFSKNRDTSELYKILV